MKLKLINIFAFMAVISILFTNVFATASVVDVNIYEEEYIQSENGNIESIYANTVQNSVVYDQNVDHSGFTYSGSTIDVLPGVYMKGVQLFASSDTLKIAGDVENIAAYSQNVVISGYVHGDVLIYANSVYIKDTAVIDGDVLIYSSIIQVEGTINGNFLAKVSGATKITGTVNGQVKLVSNNVTMQDEKLLGKVYIETNSDYTEIEKRYPDATFKKIETEDKMLDNIQNIIANGVVTVLMCTLITVLLIFKGKDFMLKLATKLKTNIVSVVLYGSLIPILSIIIIPVLIIMIMYYMGIIAWPILISYALVLIMAYVLRILIFGMLITSVVIQIKDKKQKDENAQSSKKVTPIIFTLLLYILLYGLTKISLIGSYANMLMFIISLGIIIAWFMKSNRLTIKK